MADSDNGRVPTWIRPMLATSDNGQLPDNPSYSSEFKWAATGRPCGSAPTALPG
jgi:hypothetical protein